MNHSVSKNNEERKVRIPHKQVEALYLSGKTTMEIAKIFQVSVQPIRRLLKEGGVKMRPAAARLGVLSGENNPAWNGGRRKRKDGYILVWTPKGDVLEHRKVMEDFLGRPLSKDEVVHHKDGNPSNNSLSNLEIFSTQADHAKEHGEQNRRLLLSLGHKKCTKCFLIKPLSDFYKTRSNRMGINSECKVCKNIIDARRRANRQ